MRPIARRNHGSSFGYVSDPLGTGYLAIRQLMGNRRLEIPLTLEQKVKEILVRLRLTKANPASEGNQVP